MNVEEKEILIIYNSDKIEAKRVKAYAESLQELSLKELDLAKNNITEKQLQDLADKFGGGMDELVNRKSDTYVNNYQDTELSEADTLKALVQNPEMIKNPIAVYADRAEFVDSAFDLVKEDMNDNEHAYDYEIEEKGKV